MHDGSLYMLLVLGAAIVSGIVVGSGWHRMVVAMHGFHDGDFEKGFWVAALSVAFIGGVAGWRLTRHGYLGWGWPGWWPGY